jgi:hypothetical protein
MLRWIFLLFILSLGVQAKELTYPLHFAQGRLSILTEACIQTDDRHFYPFTARQGQALSMAVTSNHNAVMLTLAYKNPQQQWQFLLLGKDYRANAWHGLLPASEEDRYLIRIDQVRQPSCYELFVGIGG